MNQFIETIVKGYKKYDIKPCSHAFIKVDADNNYCCPLTLFNIWIRPNPINYHVSGFIGLLGAKIRKLIINVFKNQICFVGFIQGFDGWERSSYSDIGNGHCFHTRQQQYVYDVWHDIGKKCNERLKEEFGSIR